MRRGGSSGPRRPRSRCRPARTAPHACRPCAPSGTARGPPRGVSRGLVSWYGKGGPRAKASGPPFLLVCLLSKAGRRSGVGGREPAGGAALAVLDGVGLAVFGGHLVEEHVGALQRWAAPQVVQRPHLLLVAQLQMRLRGHGLAVVADVAHVRHHVGPVPAVVEGLPFAVPDQAAHV